MAIKIGTTPRKPAAPKKPSGVNLQVSCGANYSADKIQAGKASSNATTPYKSTRRS